MECLQFGRSSKKYPPCVRLFCLTLHFFSPRAYEYIRSVFNFNLPTIRTIRYWYSVVDGSPGFTEEAFDALRQRVELSEGKPFMVALMFDEVSHRKHSQWDASKKEFLGHITAGKHGEYENCSPLSKEALVLMVSGIGEEFKLPIGYFLCNGLCAEEKSAIITEAIRRLSLIGVIVVCITCDGYITNITTAKSLGARFDKDQPYFQNPYIENSKIYFILDPPHMLKLTRNCLGNKAVLYDAENNEIKWKFIEDVVSLQIEKNLNFGNKLTKKHIEYFANKMNVRIAAETKSNSTATSIEFLDKVLKLELFSNSDGTTKHLQIFNNLFDTMNSKLYHTDEGFKRPLSETTIHQFSELFEVSRRYINGLEIIEDGKRKSILKTKSFTPYFGFYHNTYSFAGIYKDYIIPNGHSEFFTFNVSQDHLETFFGSIRSMGGNILMQFD